MRRSVLKNDLPYCIAVVDFGEHKVFGRISSDLTDDDIKAGMALKAVVNKLPNGRLNYVFSESVNIVCRASTLSLHIHFLAIPRQFVMAVRMANYFIQMSHFSKQLPDTLRRDNSTQRSTGMGCFEIG